MTVEQLAKNLNKFSPGFKGTLLGSTLKVSDLRGELTGTPMIRVVNLLGYP